MQQRFRTGRRSSRPGRGFRRAVRVDVEHEAGGAGVVPVGGLPALRRVVAAAPLSALGACGAAFLVSGFLGTAAEPAGLRAAGQQAPKARRIAIFSMALKKVCALAKLLKN